ncbi:MAG: hypothetical protein IKQ31_04445 [Clostridia bacterium]|nr:hypothetical protein [Clostridia bacterium]
MGIFKKHKKSIQSNSANSSKKEINFNFGGACVNTQQHNFQHNIDSRQLYLKEHQDVRDVFDKF